MSCNCNLIEVKNVFPCPCDSFIHPERLNIGMGLTELPRQVAGFPEFRRAMLYSIRPKDESDINKISLTRWTGRKKEDPGLMLLEMWAYICDSIAFYDKVIAQEEYIRTSSLRTSARKLVALLGYLPRPTVGSTVFLNAIADGRAKVKIPKGTALQSGGFDGNPPQVFETTDDCWVHPLMNKWSVKAPQREFNKHENPKELVIIPAKEIKSDSWLFLKDSEKNKSTAAFLVSSVEAFTGHDGVRYQKVELGKRIAIPKGYPLANLKLFEPKQSAGLWTGPTNEKASAISSRDKSILLDGLYREIKAGQFILIEKRSEGRWFKVTGVKEVNCQQRPGDDVFINNTRFHTPGVSVMVTKLFLDKDMNELRDEKDEAKPWTDKDISELNVWFNMQPAGHPVNEPEVLLRYSDKLAFIEKTEKPFDNYEATNFVLIDKNKTAVNVNGRIDYPGSQLLPALGTNWDGELVFPVAAHGNIFKASRGESVPREILGNGDATMKNQTFKLKKKPLTYFSSPSVANDQGVKNTLQVYVNGIRWKEVPGFFDTTPEQEIYIVRQNDEGDSFVTFGDGVRGSRLPSGIDNVMATYRFGAEKASPPAGSVTQISKPVTGLPSINNPHAAAGGDDAEAASSLRTSAPKSVLTLGRIVSIQDMDAVTREFPGIRSAQVQWLWNEEKQSPLIQVFYIGDPQIQSAIGERLRSLSEPTLQTKADVAEAIRAALVVEVVIDPRFIAEDAEREVRAILVNTSIGILAPENIGIGQPLFRSKLFSEILSVPAVISVVNIQFQNTSFDAFADTPGTGKYFDFEKGHLQIIITS